MEHQPIFKVAFCCGNMLQVFESDSKTCNIVARILLVALKSARVTFCCRLLQEQSGVKSSLLKPGLKIGV